MLLCHCLCCWGNAHCCWYAQQTRCLALYIGSPPLESKLSRRRVIISTVCILFIWQRWRKTVLLMLLLLGILLLVRSVILCKRLLWQLLLNTFTWDLLLLWIQVFFVHVGKPHLRWCIASMMAGRLLMILRSLWRLWWHRNDMLVIPTAALVAVMMTTTPSDSGVIGKSIETSYERWSIMAGGWRSRDCPCASGAIVGDNCIRKIQSCWCWCTTTRLLRLRACHHWLVLLLPLLYHYLLSLVHIFLNCLML